MVLLEFYKYESYYDKAMHLIGFGQKTEFQNKLVEILTGEGKSIVLGLLSSLF